MDNLAPFWGRVAHFIISRSALRIFFKLCSITRYNERTKGACLKFLKNYVFGEMDNLGPLLGKITYFMITGSALRIFFKLCSISRYNERTKGACLKFPEKSCFGGNGQFGHIFGQNFALLYPSICM